MALAPPPTAAASDAAAATPAEASEVVPASSSASADAEPAPAEQPSPAVTVRRSIVQFDVDAEEVQNKAALRYKVETMWAAMEKEADGTVERLKCWACIEADAEIPALIANGDAVKGVALLAAMKSARFLDISGDGQIDESEFFRLLDSFDKTYSYHPEDTARHHLTHLSSAAGGGSGGLIRSLKTPAGLHGAQLVL